MSTPYAEPVLTWYARNARDLPWRAPGATPWAVLVSEIMLQQTPVARVLPEYLSWLARWPTPAALAAEPAGEAIRQWGRLGYPRRALRLHETATILTTRHGGMVPADLDALLALPGIGSYTAAAVASFAFGQRHAVLDTNVRRVLARLVAGQADARRLGVGGGAAAGRIAAARRARGRGPLVRRGDGTGRAGMHGRQPALRYLPGGPRLRLAGRRSPGGAGPRRPSAGPRSTTAPTGSAAAACWRCCARPATRCPGPTSTRSGTARPSWTGRWTGWWPTAWSTHCPTAALRFPDRPRRSRALHDRGHFWQIAPISGHDHEPRHGIQGRQHETRGPRCRGPRVPAPGFRGAISPSRKRCRHRPGWLSRPTNCRPRCP